MADGNRHWEENAARLIRGAFGPEARPDPIAVERTRELLQLHAGRAESVFWDRAAAILAGILMVLAVWLAAQTLGTRGPVAFNLPWISVALLLSVNVACVPVAGALILIRRRYAQAT